MFTLTIYILRCECCCGNTNKGIYTSTDSGTTWRTLAYLSSSSKQHPGPFESSVAAVDRQDSSNNLRDHIKNNSSHNTNNSHHHDLYVNGRHTVYSESCPNGKNPQVPRVSGFSTGTVRGGALRGHSACRGDHATFVYADIRSTLMVLLHPKGHTHNLQSI